MAGISDYIMKKLLGEAQASQQPAAPPQGQPEQMPSSPAQEGGPPQQMPGGPGGQQIDPKVDFIAKKLATLTGSPEEKYGILVQLIPQIVEAFGPQQEQGQPPPGAGYDVSGQVGAMPPQ